MASTTYSVLGLAARESKPSSFGVDSGIDSDVPLTYGRAQEIDEIVALIDAGNDVVVEAEDGLGRTNLAAAVEYALTSRNWRTVDIANWSPTAQENGPVLVTVDIEKADPSLAATLDVTPANPGVRFLMTRQPAHPFDEASSFDEVARVRRAHVVRLLPLTQADVDALIDEQLARSRMRSEPGQIERLWVYANSGGYPELAVAILHDCDDAPEEAGSLSRFSRSSIVAASKILGGLPTSLQGLASALLPLVGVRMARIGQFFDRVEVALLMQTHIMSDAGAVLVIPGPIQTALRLRAGADERRGLTRDVIADICTAHVVGAPCNEAEIFAASAALGADKKLRVLVPLESQRAVLVTAMMLARNRGDYNQAAAVARRLMTVFPDAYPVMVKTIARGAPDSFEALGNRLANARDFPAQTQWWVWISCLQLPYFHVADGVIDLVEHSTTLVGARERGRFEALGQVVRAAALLNQGRSDEACEGAERVLVLSDTAVSVRVRALLIVAAVSAMRLDHARLRDLESELYELVRASRRGDDLESDLDARSTIEGLLGLSVCFVAAGLRSSARIVVAVEQLIVDVLCRDETTSFGPLALVYLLERSVANDGESVVSTARVLKKAKSTVLLDWVSSLTDGGRSTAAPEHLAGSRFMRYAIQIMNLTLAAFARGTDAFAVALDEVPGTPSVFRTLATQFSQSLELEVNESCHELPIGADQLEPHSLPWALATTVAGLQTRDTRRVLSGAETLLELGGAEFADRALAAATQYDVPTETEEKIHELRAQASTRQSDDWGDVVLTRRERQVAILAAQGVSNREIARQLFLSVRTVESHMYRAMRKLAVTRDGLNLAKLLRMPEEA